MAVIGGVLVVLLALLAPAIQWRRESQRRALCSERMGLIGKGLLRYSEANNGRLPPSANVRPLDGRLCVGGWSLLDRILPYMEYSTLYGGFSPPWPDAACEGMTEGPPYTEDTVARDTSLSDFICPSCPNGLWQTPEVRRGSVRQGAVTNYKGIGATHIESLNQCVHVGKPIGGEEFGSPNGVMCPGQGVRFADISKGTSNTVMCVETIDNKASLWCWGRDATLVGLSITGDDAALPKMRTYLSFDFDRADAGTYPAFCGRQPAYGPSSGHGKVVNHLFADGSVRFIEKNIDPLVYFTMITRDREEAAKAFSEK